MDGATSKRRVGRMLRGVGQDGWVGWGVEMDGKYVGMWVFASACGVGRRGEEGDNKHLFCL